MRASTGTRQQISATRGKKLRGGVLNEGMLTEFAPAQVFYIITCGETCAGFFRDARVLKRMLTLNTGTEW